MCAVLPFVVLGILCLGMAVTAIKRKRTLGAVASLIALFVVVFLIANLVVGSGSTETVVEVARLDVWRSAFQPERC
jgi:hypothetical protein